MNTYNKLPIELKALVNEYVKDKDTYNKVVNEFRKEVLKLVVSGDFFYANFEGEKQHNIYPNYISNFHYLYKDEFIEKPNHKYYNRNKLIRELHMIRKDYIKHKKFLRRRKIRKTLTFSEHVKFVNGKI